MRRRQTRALPESMPLFVQLCIALLNQYFSEWNSFFCEPDFFKAPRELYEQFLSQRRRGYRRLFDVKRFFEDGRSTYLRLAATHIGAERTEKYQQFLQLMIECTQDLKAVFMRQAQRAGALEYLENVGDYEPCAVAETDLEKQHGFLSMMKALCQQAYLVPVIYMVMLNPASLEFSIASIAGETEYARRKTRIFQQLETLWHYGCFFNQLKERNQPVDILTHVLIYREAHAYYVNLESVFKDTARLVSVDFMVALFQRQDIREYMYEQFKQVRESHEDLTHYDPILTELRRYLALYTQYQGGVALQQDLRACFAWLNAQPVVKSFWLLLLQQLCRQMPDADVESDTVTISSCLALSDFGELFDQVLSTTEPLLVSPVGRAGSRSLQHLTLARVSQLKEKLFANREFVVRGTCFSLLTANVHRTEEERNNLLFLHAGLYQAEKLSRATVETSQRFCCGFGLRAAIGSGAIVIAGLILGSMLLGFQPREHTLIAKLLSFFTPVFLSLFTAVLLKATGVFQKNTINSANQYYYETLLPVVIRKVADPGQSLFNRTCYQRWQQSLFPPWKFAAVTTMLTLSVLSWFTFGIWLPEVADAWDPATTIVGWFALILTVSLFVLDPIVKTCQRRRFEQLLLHPEAWAGQALLGKGDHDKEAYGLQLR